MSDGYREESHPTEETPAQRRRVEGAPQRPRWTLSSSIEDVLNVRVGQSNGILLNDFLRQYIGPSRAVGEDQNVWMEVFVQQPRAFIEDENVLGLILASPSYTAIREEMEGARRLREDARKLREDVRKLTERMVATLRDWKDLKDKSIVSAIAQTKLKAALQQAEDAEKERWGNEKPPRRPRLEGFYESVFNATWSHVMGFPEGEGEDMVVIEG
ncbi:retrotransposon hot spot (RHS) protein [Trypanosoma rangeli]|uniref:Retrotransposon hot spot (RHS) protein n=1 Tax=Trypanosoma rangeli TaxID=5698 RepID=A0A422MRM4_TRYRA|nr:retrotransposon hot spot (RHS) protein [Trypanosoma rangeli]RNE95840.1 retrotransposon hot spot (RHS) protein [Trypanosoma rangeli]|eukprot:RNE95840.1 retrotransposon hot spot (RHS) protein [Trypanosoma rangeli]